LRAEETGVIADRTAMINECLRDILTSARRQQPKAS